MNYTLFIVNEQNIEAGKQLCQYLQDGWELESVTPTVDSVHYLVSYTEEETVHSTQGQTVRLT